MNQVERAINNTVCRSTGETPSKLLFGVEQFQTANDNLRIILDSISTEERDLASLRESASKRIVESQEENERYYNLRRKAATRYNKNDYVMIRNIDTSVGSNKKLISKYKGPYIVKEVLDMDRYIISDVDGFQITQLPYNGIVAADQMKRYIK